MKRLLAAIILVCLAAPVASAHGGDGPLTPRDVWHHWNFDPWLWAPMLAAHIAYGRGVSAAWARAGRGRIIETWRVLCFLAGEVLLVIALISPLDPLGETLLTAHMAQHIILTAAAPPLLVLGLPGRAWLWAMPASWRRAGAHPWARASADVLERLSRPVTATIVHALAIWVWHAPALFEAALAEPWVHSLEHMTFLASALLFWRAALGPHARPAVGAAIVLLTFMHSGMLGGLLTLAPSQLYGWYGGYAQLWGMTGLLDQQVAGLSMWVPGGAIYLVAFALLTARALASPALSSRPSQGIMRASTSSRSMK